MSASTQPIGIAIHIPISPIGPASVYANTTRIPSDITVSTTDDHTDCHVEHVATHGELFEFI